MSLMLKLIAKNIPLHGWREWEGREHELENVWLGLDGGGKKLENTVGVIVRGLSHDEVQDLVVKEFSALAPIVRMKLTDMCNNAFGSQSGNVTKGISRVDKRLGGKLLREEHRSPTMQTRHVVGGRVFYEGKTVNPAVAGAQRKYAETVLPENFDSLSKKDKKRVQRELAHIRRNQKGGR